MRFLTGGLIVLSVALSGVAVAQQQTTQDDPLAAAARRVREQKKLQAKTTKVWDNDNIPRAPGSVSVVGQAAADGSTAADGSSAAAASGDNKAGSGAPKESAAAQADKKAELQSDLVAAKEALQNLQNDIDIMQRKLALDQQTYYGKPDYSSDKAGAAALKDQQDQIDAKQEEMGAAQKKIEDLQAELNSLAESKTASK